MPVPDGNGSDASPGLYASLRSFWSVVVAIFYTRLDLLTSELQEEGTRLLKFVIAALVSVLSFFMAFFFAMYLLIAMFWDTEYRLYVIGGILAFYLFVGIILVIIARNMIVNRPKFLSQTIAELRRDAESLLPPTTVVKKGEAKS